MLLPISDCGLPIARSAAPAVSIQQSAIGDQRSAPDTRNPTADPSIQRSLAARVATACLLHDVRGAILKILSGELPRLPSEQIEEAPE